MPIRCARRTVLRRGLAVQQKALDSQTPAEQDDARTTGPDTVPLGQVRSTPLRANTSQLT